MVRDIQEVVKKDPDKLGDFIDLADSYNGFSDDVLMVLLDDAWHVTVKNISLFDDFVGVLKRNDFTELFGFYKSDAVRRALVYAVEKIVLRGDGMKELDVLFNTFNREDIKELFGFYKSDVMQDVLFGAFKSVALNDSDKDKSSVLINTFKRDDIKELFKSLVNYDSADYLFEIFEDLGGEYLDGVVSCLREYNNKDDYVNIAEFYSVVGNLDSGLLDASVETKVEIGRVFGLLKNTFESYEEEFDVMKKEFYEIVNKNYAQKGKEKKVLESLKLISKTLTKGFDDYNDNSLRYVA
ncbi:hypothetical protein DRJ25_01020 [Candidatus Woesearchaeota archaeon]|nr:MAG: hypothetical protein DRJ25_01020 [Candidatus Woesearchaeota archaeon]